MKTEEWTLERRIRVDIALQRGKRLIASEICSTSNAGQEVSHASRRFEAGFTDIAIVCKSQLRLTRIQQEIEATLPPENVNRVGYYQLEEFIAQLDDWARQDPAGGELERSKPRKREIRLQSKLSDDDRSRQEKAFLEEIARAMKSPGPSPS